MHQYSRTTPRLRFVIAHLLFATGVATSLYLLISAPWPGARFEPAYLPQAGLRVDYVDPSGPAARVLAKEDVVVAVQDEDGASHPTPPEAAESDFKTLTSYAAFDRALQALNELHPLLDRQVGKPLRLKLSDGRIVTLIPASSRPIHTLPFGTFWLPLVSVVVSLIVSAGIWAFLPLNAPSRYFVVAGFLVVILTIAALYTRNAGPFWSGTAAKPVTACARFLTLMAAAAFVAFSWNYPSRTRISPYTPWLFLAMLGFWIMGEFRIGGSYKASYSIPHMILYVVGVSSYLVRWSRAEAQSQEKLLSGYLAAINIIGLVPYHIFHHLPQALGYAPWLPEHYAARCVQLIHVAMAFLIYRYRLFGIDRWMVSAWAFFLSGSFLILTDMLMVAVLGVQLTSAFWLSIAVIAWGYFPLRQALWRGFRKRLGQSDLADALPNILKYAVTSESATAASGWQELLKETFHPMLIEPAPCGSIEQPSTAQGGLMLDLPASASSPALRLHGADRAQRYFTSDDEKLASALIHLFEAARHSKGAVEHGQHIERRRIARDLHDNVMPPLLSFFYKVGDTRLAASVRDIIGRLRTQLQDLERDLDHP